MENQVQRYRPYRLIPVAAVARAAWNHRKEIANGYKRVNDFVSSEMAKRQRKSAPKRRKSTAKPAGKSATTTFQKDHAVTFRRTTRRVPRSLKVFKAKVRAVEAESRGVHRFVKHDTCNIDVQGDISNPNVQTAAAAHLYGCNGVPEDQVLGESDINLIQLDIDAYHKKYLATAQGEHAETYDFTQIQNKFKRNKMYMKHAHMEVSWVNQGTTNIEMDVYTIVYSRQPIEDPPGLVTSFLTGANDGNSLHLAINAASTGTNALPIPNLGNRGVTPFDIPGGFARIGGKIIKSERFMLAPSQVVTKTYRDSKNRVLVLSDNPTPDSQFGSFQKKGFTVSFLGIFRNQGQQLGAPGFPNAQVDSLIKMRRSVSYSWTIYGQVTPRQGYLNEVEP